MGTNKIALSLRNLMFQLVVCELEFLFPPNACYTISHKLQIGLYLSIVTKPILPLPAHQNRAPYLDLDFPQFTISSTTYIGHKW